MRTKEKNNQYLKGWRARNPDKVRAISATARRKHGIKRAADALIYQKHRRATNPEYRLRSNLRRRLHKALKGALKSSRTLGIVGASLSDLKVYLESKFSPGMTWENYGPIWHVDHIRPCASFDLVDPAQQRECFRYTNLQPLFARDNQQKNCKYDPNPN